MARITGRTYALMVFGVVVAMVLAWYNITVVNVFPGSTGPYTAPFPDEKSSGELMIPHSYIIHLFPGHSIDTLNAAIAQDIMPLMGVIINPSRDEEREGLIFGVYRVEDELLAAIRTYRGVERV